MATDTVKASVKGPASYFPSIEKTYGQPVQHWLDLIGQRLEEKHMDTVPWLNSEHSLGHRHANALTACAHTAPKG